MFDGTKAKWRGWKLEMEGKIEEDANAIGTPKAQLRYIYTRLEGPAKTSITTFYELELGKVAPSPQALIRRLDLLYGERNRKDKAIQALHTIRQKENESFTAFYPRFEREIANAEAEGWEDSAKISYLRNALHPKLKAHLIGCPQQDLKSYPAFAQKCEEIGNQMELFGEWKDDKKYARQQIGQPQSESNNVAHTTYMMEWEPTNAIEIKSLSFGKNLTGYPSKRPEDQPLLGKRAKWVEKSEIEKRRVEGRCLRCGRDGCRLGRCPLAAAIPPTSRRINVHKNITKDRERISEAAVEEESETEE
ncbi:pol-like protein [Colletotrichum musicola]|uniref:Pol-like protein n=2 Tax=Colletotrichum orchidearum species complex TaxID=2707337 RepID=A0A8H6IRQ3_9PEZI|nr:pol-like protein [Colletotrichum sojae]KAF6794288.1 pol-like protein [Colletotrichum musicola]